MNQLNKNKVGLTLGLFYALCHVSWILIVAIGAAKPLLDWVLSLHFLEFSYAISPIQIFPAAMLIAFTFVAGYITGWILATLWNVFNR